MSISVNNQLHLLLDCSPSGAAQQQQLVLHGAMNGAANGVSKALLPTAAGGNKEYTPSAAVAKRLPSKWPRPVWHPPWKLFRVISGHLGYACYSAYGIIIIILYVLAKRLCDCAGKWPRPVWRPFGSCSELCLAILGASALLLAPS